MHRIAGEDGQRARCDDNAREQIKGYGLDHLRSSPLTRLWRLTIGGVGGKVLRNRPLPSIAVRQQLVLVVDQFLARLGGKFKVRPLDDRIHRAGFLAEAAVDALGHVDVVARSEEHTSELQSLMRSSYAVFCLKKKNA